MSGWIGIATEVALAAQVASAALTGTVRDAASGHPLTGATVALVDLHRVTRTSSDGRYAFAGVPPGPQHIVVRYIGHAPRTLHALVPPDGVLEINISLVAVPTHLPRLTVQPAIVVPGIDDIGGGGSAERAVSRSAVRHYPLLTEPDAFLALGGGWVHAQPESPTGLHIRGGASDQTAYLLDGIPVFSPYHTAGMFSGWNPDAIAELHLSSSLPEAWAPHTLSGTVSAVTRAAGPSVEAQGSASTSHARFLATGTLGPPGSSFLLSGRTGYPALIAKRHDASFQRGRTGDWLARLERATLGGRLRLLGFVSEDELDAQAAADVAGGPPARRLRNRFEWSSTSVGAVWRREGRSADWRAQAWSARGSAGALWLAEAGSVALGSARHDRGLAVATERRSRNATTTWGARLERVATDYRVDRTSGDSMLVGMAGSAVITTARVEQDRTLGTAWRLRLGAAAAGERATWRLSPHAQLEWQWTPALSLSASYARAHQFAQSLRNPESLTGNVFPADLYVGPGTPGMPIAHSDQGVIAARYTFAAGPRVGAQAYARSMRGLVLVAPADPEPFATRSFVVGAGTARGASVDVAMSAKRWGATASYGAQYVEYVTGSLRYIPDHGARHLAEVGTIVFPTATSSIRIGLAAEAGRRATLPSGAFEWEACNLRDRGCEFGGSPRTNGGPLGGTVLPGYARLDVGVQKHWHLGLRGRDATVALFGAVTNVVGRRNVLTFARDPVTGAYSAVDMRPQSPLVFGLDWRF
ncbi:MAG: TonB-dependent receptor [Gemmatimonadaceae bacterium]